jgi:hypothetical protein
MKVFAPTSVKAVVAEQDLAQMLRLGPVIPTSTTAGSQRTASASARTTA